MKGLHEISSDTPDELHIPLHDSDAFPMERAEIRVFKEMN